MTKHHAYKIKMNKISNKYFKDREKEEEKGKTYKYERKKERKLSLISLIFALNSHA